MIVVSDTSPIRALANLRQLELLTGLFGNVIVPTAVALELLKPIAGMAPIDLSLLSFVEVRQPRVITAATEGLDAGEAEAISIALELDVKTVLMDEMLGRSIAVRCGLSVTGTLGILLQARRRGLVPKVAPLVDELRLDWQFFISDRVRTEVLRLAGELP
jgi:predicted nucleic acid-binding protein